MAPNHPPARRPATLDVRHISRETQQRLAGPLAAQLLCCTERRAFRPGVLPSMHPAARSLPQQAARPVSPRPRVVSTIFMLYTFAGLDAPLTSLPLLEAAATHQRPLQVSGSLQRSRQASLFPGARRAAQKGAPARSTGRPDRMIHDLPQ
jgi:hypothetical protein